MTIAATDLSRLHHRAIFDLLTPLGYQTFFGKVDVPDASLTYPYLIVWVAPGSRGQINLAGNLYDLTTRSQLTAVGRDVDESLAAIDRAADLLQGVRPTITGRKPGLIRQDNDVPFVLPDNTVQVDGQPTYMAVNFFVLNSTAAPA